jgi:hypothetical protein
MNPRNRLLALPVLVLGLFSLGAAPAASDPVEVDIVKLTSIDWKQGQELPQWIRDLDGKEVVISGFMFTQFRDETDELLVVGNSCQCSGTPLPQHFVKTKLDKKTTYKGGELTFIGTFRAGEVVEDGFVTSLYRLDGKFF